MFKSAGLAKMFAGRRKFFRGPHVRHPGPNGKVVQMAVLLRQNETKF